jgi:hypothetical protein
VGGLVEMAPLPNALLIRMESSRTWNRLCYGSVTTMVCGRDVRGGWPACCTVANSAWTPGFGTISKLQGASAFSASFSWASHS